LKPPMELKSTWKKRTPKRNKMALIPNKKILSQDRIVGTLFFISTLLSVLVTLSIVFFLGKESWLFFQKVSFWEFFSSKEWSPQIPPLAFGVRPLLVGTFQITIAAGLFAIPLGTLVAVYLSEYASPKTRSWMKPTLDLIAGIPSVVYGFFAVTVITPFLKLFIPSIEFFNTFSAGLVVGIMILPLVTSLTEESLRALPKEFKQAASALGATKSQVTWGILIPAAGSGIVASFIIGLSRAIGETMAVTLAAGATPRLTWSPLVGIQTMTAYIAQVSLGDTPTNSVEYESMFAVGALLFCITFGLNIIARKIIRKVKLHHA
jgi:phosphate transport system permease protein